MKKKCYTYNNMKLKSLYASKLYMEDIQNVINIPYNWEQLMNKSIVLTGATGLIGSFLIDVILEKNRQDDLNCTIYAMGRDKDKAIKRFEKYKEGKDYHFISYDVKKNLECNNINKVDYVVHLAANTHPLLYSTDPIGTITTNVIGLRNLLDFSVENKAERFIFASSNEIYGENRGDVEFFSEDYCGYIDCNSLRAGYPESKRCGEALCQAYKFQKNLNIGIARFTRTYGPTMNMSDTKAISQFIKNCVYGENIVLKSEGIQYFSYTYMVDAVSGLLWMMLNGENGNAYNVAFTDGDIRLKDLADIFAKINGKKVIFELPNNVEAAGYSKATKARLSGNKLFNLGWKPIYDIETGVRRTVEIINELTYI